ncbi:MAG: FAD-dependent oxidoreductase [Alphaproteobacteria bacterium]|nr:FAD-dependent oxidoreductase [Alphaproteobacteria bacterium]
MPQTELPPSAEVAIVGAGPTGLALAISLAQSGVDAVVIDKLACGQNSSRATVIHAHTLEALRPLGVAEALSEAGLKLTRFKMCDRDRVLMRLQFNRLPSEYAYLLMLPQNVTEAILTARLEALGGRVHCGVAATAIEQCGSHARVWIDAGGGQSRALDATYVVGADGMHSVVREAAGIAFDGGQYAQSFVLADVKMHWPAGRTTVTLFFAREGPLVIAPLPNGDFRIVAAMADAPECPDAGDVQSILDANGPAAERLQIEEVVWSSRFRIHHRLAKAYRNGRLLIMGDAAHVHSPAGGQGMNTGLVDAAVLGRLLASVVRGAQPDHALDEYESLRRPAARKVLVLAGRLTDMAMTRGAFARAARNARLSLMNCVPPVKRAMTMNLSGLSRRHQAECAGERV